MIWVSIFHLRQQSQAERAAFEIYGVAAGISEHSTHKRRLGACGRGTRKNLAGAYVFFLCAFPCAPLVWWASKEGRGKRKRVRQGDQANKQASIAKGGALSSSGTSAHVPFTIALPA